MVFQRPLTETFLGEHAPRHPLSTPPSPPPRKKIRPPLTLQLFFPVHLQNLTLRRYKRQLAFTPGVAASCMEVQLFLHIS